MENELKDWQKRLIDEYLHDTDIAGRNALFIGSDEFKSFDADAQDLQLAHYHTQMTAIIQLRMRIRKYGLESWIKIGG